MADPNTIHLPLLPRKCRDRQSARLLAAPLLAMCLALLTAAGCSKQGEDTAQVTSTVDTDVPPRPQVSLQDMEALIKTAKRGPTSRHTPRRYARTPRPEAEQAIVSLAAVYAQAANAEQRTKVLEKLSEYCDPSVLPLVEQALQDSSSDVRVAGLEALEGYTSKDVVPLVMKGLLDESVDVRQAAMEALSCVEDAAAVEPIALAFTDTDEDVREAAFDCMQELDYNSRLSLLEEALRVPAADVRCAAISELEDLSNHDAMDLLIGVLGDSDAEVRDEASSAIWFLVSEEFEDPETARQWWEKNRGRFDDELFEKD